MKSMNRWLAALLLLVLVCAPVQAQGAAIREKCQRYSSSSEAGWAKVTTCQKGDKGSSVTKIKSALKNMGYYRSTATYDDEFNDTMVQRVKLFQENNGLEVTGRVDSVTLSMIKGYNAVPGEYYTGSWSEPDVTLIIPENTYGQWQEKSNDRFNFRIKVKNISQSRTIKAIEFYVYTKDIWGEEIISEYCPYAYTVESRFEPGEMAYTGYMTIPYRRETEEVYIAINKVRYTNGTTETVNSNKYYSWTIRW